MKKIPLLLLLFSTVFFLFKISSSAQDTTVKKSMFETLLKKSDSVKFYTDSLKKINKTNSGPLSESTGKTYSPKETAILIIVISFFTVMIFLLFRFFRHLKDNKQRIGYQSIKLIGLILIFPGICILALVGGKDILSGETLAVLLGTIAGYVLSREDDKESTSHDATKKKEEELQAENKLLEDQIKSIKEKNPNLVT